MSQPRITDYYLVIEQDPHDPTSDLLGVRREGGRMFSGEKPAGTPKGAIWYGEKRTCVDRIPRAGNGAGKVAMATSYKGWVKLTYAQIRGNALTEWLAPYPSPVDLRTL